MSTVVEALEVQNGIDDEIFYTLENVPLPVNRNLRYAMARSGKLPTIRCGRRILIPKRAFDEWVRTCGGTFTGVVKP